MTTHFSGTAVLTHDPVIEINEDGDEYCQVRLKTTDKRYDKRSGEWVKDQTMYFSMRTYRQLAKNLVASVIKDDQLIIIGELRQEGHDLQLLPKELGVGLRYHAAIVTKYGEEDQL